MPDPKDDPKTGVQGARTSPFSDYHLYTRARRTTIANRETKQLSLLNGTGIPVEKRYVVDGRSFYYRIRVTYQGEVRHIGTVVKRGRLPSPAGQGPGAFLRGDDRCLNPPFTANAATG